MKRYERVLYTLLHPAVLFALLLTAILVKAATQK